MKNKKDKTFYINRAKRDIRDLFIYFNITRPQHERAYFKDGKFSLNELVRQMEFLSDWRKRSKVERKSLAKFYSTYSKTFNYVFGIPKDLIGKVAGVYYDEDGNQHRVNYEQVIDDLVKEGFVKVVNAGRKFDRTEDGQYKVKCWWCKKYIMANRKQWLKLMTNEHYDNINKYGSDRLRKIVFKWVSSFKEEKIECPDKTKENRHENQVEVANQNQTSNTETTKEVREVMNDSRKKEISKKIITVCVEAGIINPETAVAWMGDLVYFRRQNPFTIDEAKMLYNTKSVQNKNEFRNRLLGYLLTQGIKESEAIYVLIDNIKD